MGRIVRTGTGVYICPGPESVSSQGDLLELIALSGEAGTDRLLFPRGSLAEDFFDLSSGLAGELGLKLSTYRVKAAFVVDLDKVPSQRFREWAGECNRGREIHFSDSEESAVEWLLA
jgi:PadR family transcriptional regulator AphA